MNQILYVEEKKKNQKADIKTIVLFFSIAIIVFGIILISKGSYALYANSSDSTIEEDIKPTIETDEDGENLVLTVMHPKGINRILYHWNNEGETVISGNKQTSVVEEIKLPVGKNTLTIKIFDINNKETIYQQDYEVEDLGEAKIDFIVGNNTSTMKIKATDTKGLSYITYRWNDGTAETIEADSSDPTTIEKSIEIPFGLNKLTVVAVNVDGVNKTKEQEIKGVKTTKVEAALTTNDGRNAVTITLTDESGIKSVRHDSTETGSVDLPIQEGQTVISYTVVLVEGENKMNLTIINNDDVKTEQEIIVNN